MKIKNEKTKDFFIALAIVFAGAVFLLFFKIKHSMTFPNLDEFLWMYRSRFFMDRVLDFDFANLIQSYHPGIMVMWAAGPFMEIINYDFNSIARFIKSLNDSGVGYNVINSQNQDLYDSYKSVSFLFNIPIFAAIFLFIFSLYYLLRKLALGRWAIIFSLLLIVTTPYYIYFTTPTDKFVGIFSTLGVLSLLVYAKNKNAKKFLILSAIFSAWAVLTKMSALFLIPFSFFVLAVYELNFQHGRKALNEGEQTFVRLRLERISEFLRDKFILILATFKLPLKNTIKNFLLWLAVFFLTSVIFFPTILANPRAVMNLIIKESSERIITENHSLLFAPNVALAYLSDPFALSFNLFVIIVFFGFLFLLIKNIFRISPRSPRWSLSSEPACPVGKPVCRLGRDSSELRAFSSQSPEEEPACRQTGLRLGREKISVNNEILLLYFYCFSFFAFIVLFSKTYSFRYLVPILVIFQILAGAGIYEFANIFIKKNKITDKKLIYIWAIIFILVSQGLLIYFSEIARIENLPYFG